MNEHRKTSVGEQVAMVGLGGAEYFDHGGQQTVRSGAHVHRQSTELKLA